MTLNRRAALRTAFAAVVAASVMGLAPFASAQVGVSESLTGLGTGLADAGDAMRRAQDKTSQMQAKAEALEGMTEAGILSDPLDQRDSTEKALDKLRTSTGVDADLARLKAEMASAK